jgi:hypothetical protein
VLARKQRLEDGRILNLQIVGDPGFYLFRVPSGLKLAAEGEIEGIGIGSHGKIYSMGMHSGKRNIK